MAKGVNKVIIVGNLGQDPEVRYMPNGNAVANITVATSESWKKDGEKHEKTEWHRVVFFGKIAEIAGQYLHKGSQCYIEGRLQTREWEKDGVKRYTTEIVVDMQGTLQLLGGKGDGQQQAQRQQSTPRAQPQRPQQSQQAAPPDFDDDIPFRQAHYLSGI